MAADPFNTANLNAGQEELVEVFDTQVESEAMVVKGLLESAGIDALISNLDAPQDVLPGVGGVIIRVRREQADEAMKLIAENQGATDDEIAADMGETPGPNEEPA